MIPYPGGIPCHEEEPGEPCGCNQSQCGNPSGRYRSGLLEFPTCFQDTDFNTLAWGLVHWIKEPYTRFKASFILFSTASSIPVFLLNKHLSSQVRPDNGGNAFCWGENGNCLPWMRRNRGLAVNKNNYLVKLVKRTVQNTWHRTQSWNTKLRTKRMSFVHLHLLDVLIWIRRI